MKHLSDTSKSPQKMLRSIDLSTDESSLQNENKLKKFNILRLRKKDRPESEMGLFKEVAGQIKGVMEIGQESMSQGSEPMTRSIGDSVPARSQIAMKTIPQLFIEAAQKYSTHVAYQYKDSFGATHTILYQGLLGHIENLAAGLKKLGLSGKKMIIISDNCVHLPMAIMASMSSGGIDVEKENNYPTGELKHIFNIISPDFVCLQNKESYEKFLSIEYTKEIPLIFFNTENLDIPSKAKTFEEVCDLGLQYKEKTGETHILSANLPSPDDTATVVFTSGTTGTPKGVCLSHQNLAFACAECSKKAYLKEFETYLSFVHMRHIGEKISIFMGLTNGYKIVVSSVPELRDDLTKVNPHIMTGSPVLLKALKDAVFRKMGEMGKEKIFEFFYQHSLQYIQATRVLTQTVGRTSHATSLENARALLDIFLHGPLHGIAKLLFYRKIKSMTGNRLRVLVSGGAYLHRDLDDFFQILGYRLINIYGSNETTALVTVRDWKNIIQHTIGKLVAHTEVKILDPETLEPCPLGEPGLLFVRGPQVFQGYFGNPKATDAVLSNEGWYNTGDIVREVLGGSFQYIGRAGDSISLLDRNNVEPEPIERLLESSQYIKHAVIFGQKRSFLTALIVPNFENIRIHFKISESESNESISQKKEVVELCQREVDKRVTIRNGFMEHELIRGIALVADEFVAGDQLTFTMKKKRNAIEQKYTSIVNRLFEETLAPEVGI